jgi:hypothetical protein
VIVISQSVPIMLHILFSESVGLDVPPKTFIVNPVIFFVLLCFSDGDDDGEIK